MYYQRSNLPELCNNGSTIYKDVETYIYNYYQELRSVKISHLLNPQTGLTENIDGVIKEYKETRGLLVRSLYTYTINLHVSTFM